MTDAAASTTTDTPAAPQKGRRLLWLSLAALLLGGAGALWWFMQGSLPACLQSTSKSAKVSDPIFVPLEPFTVNLQPNGRARFLHIAVTLKVAEAPAQALLVKYLPEVRSRVLAVLANLEADALLLPEEKTRLAGDIQKRLQEPLAPGLAPQALTSVMFTTFMLQ